MKLPPSILAGVILALFAIFLVALLLNWAWSSMF